VCQILEVDDEWNILKCTLHWRGVQNISITLAKLVEFLVISIFHETKIRKVDMKAHVYSKFRENKISKKVKSPNSMRNGRFDTSKWRGKLEKMGVLCIHSPKSLGPFSKTPIKNWPKCRRKHQKKKIQKKWTRPTLSRFQPAAGGRPLVAGRPWAHDLGSTTSGRQAASDQQSGSNCPAETRARPLVADSSTTSDRPPAVGRCLDRVGLPLFFEFFFCVALHFLHK
jgi:hypothetical protein